MMKGKSAVSKGSARGPGIRTQGIDKALFGGTTVIRQFVMPLITMLCLTGFGLAQDGKPQSKTKIVEQDVTLGPGEEFGFHIVPPTTHCVYSTNTKDLSGNISPSTDGFTFKAPGNLIHSLDLEIHGTCDGNQNVNTKIAIKVKKIKIMEQDVTLDPGEPFGFHTDPPTPCVYSTNTKDLSGRILSSSDHKSFTFTAPNDLNYSLDLEIHGTCDGNQKVFTKITINAPETAQREEINRAIVGVENGRASSATAATRLFIDGSVSIPLKFKTDSELGERLRLVFDGRLTSVPLAVDQITISNAVKQGPTIIKSLKLNEVSHAFEFLPGFELRVGNGTNVASPLLGPGKQKISTNLFVSGGFTTPISPNDAGSTNYFNLSDPNVQQYFNLPSTRNPNLGNSDRQLVLATPPDRTRFFGQYYVGSRFKIHYYDDMGNLAKLFPSTFDIALGNNAALGGCLTCGGVLHKSLVTRIDWFYSLPFDKVKMFHIFGTALFKFSQGTSTVPFLSSPVTDANPTEVSAAIVAISPESKKDRDFYRLGIGVDVSELLKGLKGIKFTAPN